LAAACKVAASFKVSPDRRKLVGAFSLSKALGVRRRDGSTETRKTATLPRQGAREEVRTRREQADGIGDAT
jgi:hypothetical protein